MRRRRLASELRKIRESKGRSADRVAAALNWSASKISRYERARTGLRPREVERLLDYYGITGQRRTILLGLAEDAAQKGWWEAYEDTIPADLQHLIGIEYEAATIDVWEAVTVPALLRTEAYERTLIKGHARMEPTPPRMIERLVEVCMHRQAYALDRESQQITVLLDESVLHRRIGDSEVMTGQLRRLTDDIPNMTLRIVPIDTTRSLTGESFTIFGFGTPDDGPVHQEVVAVGHLRGSYFIEQERETFLYRTAYEAIMETAYGPSASRKLIAEATESYS